RAVSDVSFALDEGELLGLMSPNGSGKTTLFNLIAGALSPDAGRIRLAGRDIAGRPAHEVCAAGVARTFQLVRPFAGLTVLENVLVGRLYGRARTTTSEAVTEARRRWRRIRTSSTSTSARPWSAARVLEIDGLQAGYGDVRALFGVTLSVGAGEIVALLGPNGAGKSTLLNCVAGLVRPRSGAIRWDGQDLRTLGAHLIVERGVALVPEGRRLFGGMTVQENLELGAFASRAWGGRRAGLERVYTLFPVLAERRRTA